MMAPVAFLIIAVCMMAWAAVRIIRQFAAGTVEGTEQPKVDVCAAGKSMRTPESQYVVAVSDDEVRCCCPDGTTESVKWCDLKVVEIHTTDEGPLLADVFWVLHGSDGGCVIPHGATGEDQFIDRLQALPEFRNHVMIDAMRSSANNRFQCWERTEGAVRHSDGTDDLDRC